MEKLARYLNPKEASALLAEMAQETGSTEIAVVRNLDYIPTPFELYVLAPKVTARLDRIAAFAVDMDGTSTTTEPLALHSLEYMVRRFTGKLTTTEWAGLDPVKDYPHVIGNSNFRHTEFLLDRYGEAVDRSAFGSAFLESLLWTLSVMDDRQRRSDIVQNAINCGLSDMLDDPAFKAIAAQGCIDNQNVATYAEPFVTKYSSSFDTSNRSAIVSAALDIYYARYHSILKRMENGEGAHLSKELLGDGKRNLVEPMPGYGVFIALIKGWLGDDAGELYDELKAYLPAGSVDERNARERLKRLAKRFSNSPAKIALVTASIAYEAHSCMKEVFRVLQEQVQSWPVSDSRKAELTEKLSDYRAVFDGFVTASDSSEARLKPHRDLFSISLYQMSIPNSDYCRCIGLEDTEPGIIALRAAGVGCAVALPNHDTSRQDYQAASHVVKGGLPELILQHNLCLEEE